MDREVGREVEGEVGGGGQGGGGERLRERWGRWTGRWGERMRERWGRWTGRWGERLRERWWEVDREVGREAQGEVVGGGRCGEGGEVQ